MKKYRVRAKKYSEKDWTSQYFETSNDNGVVRNDPRTPSGLHFKTENEANEETFKILKEQGISKDDVEVINN